MNPAQLSPLAITFALLTVAVSAQPAPEFLPSTRQPDNTLDLQLQTNTGARYRIEASSDLQEWELLTEFVATAPTTAIPITDLTAQAARFFRAEAVTDSLQATLDANRAKWEAIGWDDYRIQIDVSEFIPREVSQGIITVADDQVVDVTLPLSNGLNFGFQFNYPLSIDGLFDRLEESLARDPFNARITYHPDFGYPLEAFIDFDERIADEESGFRVTLLGPTGVVEALAFDLPEDPYRVQASEIIGNTLSVDLEYGGGCRGHLFALVDRLPGAFAESEPPRPVIALRHDSNDDLCRALIFETRTFDLTPLALSAVKTYGSPIPMILEFGTSADGGGTPTSLLYRPSGSESFLVGGATSQEWAGGVQGSGSGTDYRFQLTLIADEMPPLIEVWIGQRRYEPTLHLPPGKSEENLTLGDRVNLLCQFRRVPVFEGLPFESEIIDWRDEPPTSDGPPYEGAALIRYGDSNAPLELVIPRIDSLPPLFFP